MDPPSRSSGQHALGHQPHAEVVHLQHVGGRCGARDARDVGQHVPSGTDAGEQRVDVCRVAKIALPVLGGGCLLVTDVDRQHVIASVVEVFRNGRTDTRSRTDDHDSAHLHPIPPTQRTVVVPSNGRQ